jgi:preprotein translocase subunit SecB
MADEQAQPTRQLILQKIYIKDLSFESPKAPEVFRSNAPAQTQLNIRSAHNKIDEEHVEVTLTLTVESKDSDSTLFLVELVQAGVFSLVGYSEEEQGVLLGSFCPGTLYPFAREAISDIATKGGFPQLLLQPINFDALYAQAQQQKAAGVATGETVVTSEAALAAVAVDPVETPPQGSGSAH